MTDDPCKELKGVYLEAMRLSDAATFEFKRFIANNPNDSIERQLLLDEDAYIEASERADAAYSEWIRASDEYYDCLKAHSQQG